MSSANPSARTSNQLLADRRWRLRHSIWMLGPILSFAIMTWASFLYIGIKARRRDWQIAAILYAIGIVVVIVFTPTTPDSSGAPSGAPASGSAGDWTAGLLVALWIAGVVHAFLSNKSWLRWRAQNSAPWYATSGKAAPWYATSGKAQQESEQQAPSPTSLPPQLSTLGIDSTNYYSSPHSSEQPSQTGRHAPTRQSPSSSDPPAPPPSAPTPSFASLEVNTASVSQFAALPGFDDKRARRVVAARESCGGFSSIEQFADAAGLAPHEHHRVRALLTCSPPADPPETGPASGRVLDY